MIRIINIVNINISHQLSFNTKNVFDYKTNAALHAGFFSIMLNNILLVDFVFTGTDPCARLPPDAQPSPTGHSTDRRGAGPHRSTDRTHPAPAERRV